MKITKKIKWIGISLIYIGIIFLLSFKHPGIAKHSFVKEVITNLAHIPLYGVLGYFLIVLFKHLRTGSRAFVYTIICGMTVAGTDEFFQSFVPGRSVDAMDLGLDFIGICLGVLLFRVVRVKIRKKKLKEAIAR